MSIEIPPSDVREVIDKIAQYVAGKGRTIEEKIIEKEKDNPLFEFLKDRNNEYTPYYEAKLEEYAKSKGMHVQKRVRPLEDPTETSQKIKKEPSKAKKTQDDLRREMSKKKNLKPPPPDQFATIHPELHMLDSEIIKLTAQFVTRNGQKFLSALIDRQSNNPQFDFLKPTHKLFTYFTSLLDSYSKSFVPKSEYINKLKKYSTDKSSILENCGSRYEYERQAMWEEKEKERQKKEKTGKPQPEEEEEYEVDWDDFIIVQVIDFDEDEQFIQPDINQMGIDDVSNKIDKADIEIKKEISKMEGIMVHPDNQEGIKIVTDYVRTRGDNKESTQQWPKCGKNIPLAEWTEHLKIELLDPKWREEKIDHLNRLKNPTTAEGDQISRSIKNLMANRPDIAKINTDDRIKMMTQDQANPGGARIIWDGHSNSITRTTANSAMLAQQQRRNIEEAMKSRSGLDPNMPPMPPAFNPQLNQLRPPTQTQLLGYQLPPAHNLQNPYGGPPKKPNQDNK